MQDRLYRRGKIWHCWFYGPNGERVRKSTKCIDRSAAQLVLRRYEREAHDPNRRAPNATPHTINEALHYFVNEGCSDISPATLSMYLQKAGHLKRRLQSVDVNDITMEIVRGYINDRQSEGAKSGTIYKELVTLRQALHCAKERGLFLGDPRSVCPRFRIKYVPKSRWLTTDELLALLPELQPHRQLWTVIAIYTGGRDSEVDHLQWQDIDWDAGSVRLRGTKTAGASRTIPLHPVLSIVLERIKPKDGYIVGEWHSVRGGLHAACRRAKIDMVSPNDLRRTLASWLKQEGVDSYAVAQMLGHGSARMVELVYGKIDMGTLTRAMGKLGGCDTGVSNSSPQCPEKAPVSRTSHDQLAKILTGAVPRDRIELSTRGFSVRTPWNRFKDLDEKRRDCDNGVQPKQWIGFARTR